MSTRMPIYKQFQAPLDGQDVIAIVRWPTGVREIVRITAEGKFQTLIYGSKVTIDLNENNEIGVDADVMVYCNSDNFGLLL